MLFLGEAKHGQEILESDSMQGYSSAALSAYEVSERTSREANIQARNFRQEYYDKLNQLLQQPHEPAKPLPGVREFFHKLAEWCLAQDVGLVEGVVLDDVDHVHA